MMLTGAWILALLAAGAPLLAMGGSGDPDTDVIEDAPPDSEDTHGGAPEAGGPQEDATGETDEDADAEADETVADDIPLPTDYEFVLRNGGDHAVGGFRPGTDTLTLTSESWNFDLYDLGHDGDGAALRIVSGEMTSTLRFPGLSALPVADIWLNISGPGAEAQRVPLRDMLYPDEDVPLAPADPDAPDTPSFDPSPEPPLTPTDPDAPDEADGDDDPGEVLPPSDPDAPEHGS
jgi:hypothetical protein